MRTPSRLDYDMGLWGWHEYKKAILAWQACREMARFDECLLFEEAYAREPDSWRKYVLRQRGL